MSTSKSRQPKAKLFRYTEAEEKAVKKAMQSAAEYMEKYGRAVLPPTRSCAQAEIDDGYPAEMKLKQACQYAGIDVRAMNAAVAKGIINPEKKEGERYFRYSKEEIAASKDRLLLLAERLEKRKERP